MLRASSDTPESKAVLAEAYLASGQFDDARALLEDARAQDPENIRVLALLGPVYGRAGELDRAAEALETAFALGERGPELRRNLALVYLRQQKIEEAITELRLAAREASGNASIWFTLGNAYLQARDPSLAAEAFIRSLEIRPDWPEATFNLALALEESGAKADAAEALRRFQFRARTGMFPSEAPRRSAAIVSTCARDRRPLSTPLSSTETASPRRPI